MISRFRPPRKSTLEAWAKICDDIIKAAIIALPLVMIREHPLGQFLAFLILLMIIFVFAVLGDLLREMAE